MKPPAADPSEPWIAVIGMAGRFPGACNLTEFWRNVRDGIESISFFTDDQLLAAGASASDLQDPNYVRAAAILDNVEHFDAAFFGFSPKEAAIMDPQHRHFLECAWEALENAGWCPDEFSGQIGVYAGSGMNSYLIQNLLTNHELVADTGIFLLKQTGNDKDVLATRVSYQLNLTGPSLAVQTACSTSLVAIHLACQSLLNHECDMALAGGVTIEIPHGLGYVYREGEILSRDGHCRAFDANSSGTIFGSGLGIVVLRRFEDALRDGDIIHAVIRGTAINNDGARKVGYLAPSVAGQADAITEALAVAGLAARSISYVETHGTGTRVGDPIEITALTQAFRESTDEIGFCGIGSLKTNVGHLDAAAGVAAFIKTVLSLEHRQLPPSLNFSKPNPLIDFAGGPFFVNAKLREWNTGAEPRHAGVTSLGIGGTNAHAILEEAPPANPSGNSRPWHLLTLSAKTAPALDAMARNLADHLVDNPENLADVAFTLHRGRKGFLLRRVVVCRDAADAAAVLGQRDGPRIISNSARDSERPVAFLFPGQGAQYAGMGRELYESEHDFRSIVDFCADFLKPTLGLDLRTILFPLDEFAAEASGLLDQTRLTQPVLFVIEYALAMLWRTWGVEPKAMIGHSIGEFAAACIAGVFPLESALQIVAERGRLMQSVAPGAMTAVASSEREVIALLGESLSLATVNAEGQCVVAGHEDAVAALESRLAAKGVTFRRLRVSHAFHSAMMDRILDPFAEFVSGFELAPPGIRYVSSATGTWITDSEAMDPRYWARQLRRTVRFVDGLCELLKDPDELLVEVGPGNTLSALTAQHRDFKSTQEVVSSMRSRQDTESDEQVLLYALGQLWASGHRVDWSGFYSHESRRRVQLPTYPFERQRFWIEPGNPLHFVESSRNGRRAEQEQNDIFFRPLWKRADLPPIQASESTGPWLVFQDSAGLGTQITEYLRRRGERCIDVLPGARLSRIANDRYEIDPLNPQDYATLIRGLAAPAKMPRTIVHLWSVVRDCSSTTLDDLTVAETMSFYSLLFLSQALGAADFDGQIRIGIVANSLHSVAGEPIARPERALLFGPCGTIPKEFPNMRCCAIDVELPPAPGAMEGHITGALVEAAGQIVSELRASSLESAVVYRRNRRWVRTYQPLRLVEDRQPEQLRDRGVYLITGGLGGIGLVLAESLARSARARLVLVGRNGLPARHQWDAWLREHDHTDLIAQRILKVRAIETAGGEVIIAKADVSNPDAMRLVVADVRARFGPINGVIHGAGVLSDAPILGKDRASAARVLAPKVRGMYVLESVCANEPLDFFILMSSVSAQVAPAGQIDYAGANAVLDCFAQSRAAEAKRVVAIDWPRWRDVGMAADPEAPAEGAVVHPLLGRVVHESESEAEYLNAVNLENDWIVSEHRLKEGAGLFPGTGYVEMVRAAMARRSGDTALSIRNLHLAAPLRVEPGTNQKIRFYLYRERSRYRFSVSAWNGEAADWIECAFGEVESTGAGSPSPRNIEEIRHQCHVREIRFDGSRQNEKQAKYIDFGPRWRNLGRVYLGLGEALTLLELPVEFRSDLANYRIHPGLLDMATGSAMLLIDGYESTDRFYVPISYRSIVLFRSLPAKCYSHVRAKPGATAEAAIVSFDINIFDQSGNVIAEIRDFSLRAVAASSVLGDHPAGSDRKFTAHKLGGALQTAKRSIDSIDSDQGIRAFARILADPRNSNLIVFPSDLNEFLEKSQPVKASHFSPHADAEKEGGSSGDEVEVMLARWWRELLGVERVGKTDNFFDLGGQSLTGVRLLAKLKKTYGVDLKLATLFEAPTVERLARLVRGENAPTSFSSVVSIRPHGSMPPLFMVHGLGGRVLGFHELIRYLEPDQPIYGIEYSVSESTPAMLRMEDLAAHYLGEIRKVQPEGPYYLLGYSFGGLLAFEMAQQLCALDQPVGLLGMVDTFLMNGTEAKGTRRNLIQTAKRKAQALNFHARSVIRGSSRLSHIRDQISVKIDDVIARARGIIYATLTAWGRPIPKFLERAYDVNLFAARRYQARPYPGRITLFRASSAQDSVDERYGYELGWKPLAGAGVEVHEIPGTHRDIMREPNVGLLARHVTACLALCYVRQPSQVPPGNSYLSTVQGSVLSERPTPRSGASVS